MATILNSGKETRRLNKAAETERNLATIITEEKENGEKHVICWRTDNIEKARSLSVEAKAKSELVLEQLEKDSDRRNYYTSQIEVNERFLSDTSKMSNNY